jgi:hypothetical protein
MDRLAVLIVDAEVGEDRHSRLLLGRQPQLGDHQGLLDGVLEPVRPLLRCAVALLRSEGGGNHS